MKKSIIIIATISITITTVLLANAYLTDIDKKHPAVYFVKGYRKIAVILDSDGYFKLSARYYPHDDKIKQEILELIN